MNDVGYIFFSNASIFFFFTLDSIDIFCSLNSYFICTKNMNKVITKYHSNMLFRTKNMLLSQAYLELMLEGLVCQHFFNLFKLGI